MQRRLSILLGYHGWRAALLLCVAGALAALTLAPFHFWPLCFPAYALLLHFQLRADSRRRAFYYGWAWGLGFFLAGLYWVCIAMTTDMARFGWMIPFALFGLNGGLALFTGTAGLLFHWLRRSSLIANWALFVICMAGSEWLRGHILTGFPWNLIGYAWGASGASIQIAAWFDIYSLTAFTIAWASASLLLWHRGALLKIPFIAGSAFAVVAVGYGASVMHQPVTPSTQIVQPALLVRLVQANIPQRLKWNPHYAQHALAKHIEMSTQPASVPPTFIIWPESAFPYTIDINKPLPLPWYDWLKPEQYLITGAVLKDDASGEARYYNSLVVWNAKGEMVGRYDKQHLVPFGEYVPLSNVLPIEKIVAGLGEFATDGLHGAIQLPWFRFQSLICYESIFPAYSAPDGAADYLLTITNDAWFGYSSGPFQHEAMARFRAVEQGKPMIRVANTGVSVVFDARGNVIERLELNQSGVVDAVIAQP